MVVVARPSLESINSIQPGPTDTDMNPADGPGGDFLAPMTALGRYGSPDDVAAAVSFLAGDGGNYVTGTAFTVDGGLAA